MSQESRSRTAASKIAWSLLDFEEKRARAAIGRARIDEIERDAQAALAKIDE